MMDTKRCGIDRISSLPDEILTYILSFLSTRNAVQTCILSKRWINTWASVPVLEFKVEEFRSIPESNLGRWPRRWIVESKIDVTKFELLVKNVLEKRDTSCVINIFRLWFACGGDYSCTQVVANFISDAMKLEPRECSIKLWSCAILNLNTDLIFTCASLIDLHLWVSIGVDPHVAIEPNSINLPCLKTLNLTGHVSDDFFKKLFLGCPVLEELKLSGYSMGIIEICSNTLKKLIIHDFVHTKRLHISTPNLIYFEFVINGKYPRLDLLINMPSLVNASIYIPDWYDEDYDMFRSISGVPKLIASFSNVEYLKLQICGTDEKELKKELSNCPAFNNLKYLKLVSLGSNFFDLSPLFLHRSPKLQGLTLQNICAPIPEEPNEIVVFRLQWAATLEGLSDALVQQDFLKTVRIVGFRTDNGFVDELINNLCAHVKITGEILRV